MPQHERQITNAPYGHILTNTAVWSPDSQWVVYDVRSDPAGSVFDGTRIERVNVKTKHVEVIYESKNGACCGMATVHPFNGQVVFIQGPEFPTADWSYSACHREGFFIDPVEPGVAYALEARDIVPPFTPFALRGGTHVPTWCSAGMGGFVSFTYDDHILTHGTTPGKEPNRRTVAVAQLLPEPIVVPKTHPRNRDGFYSSEIVACTVANPKPGSDEIGRAFEDGWVPNQLAMTLIGEVVAHDGRKVNELFRIDLGDAWEHSGEHKGTETTLPLPRIGVTQTRLTRFADIPHHMGITTLPRHWPRASPDGKRIAFLTEEGRLQVFPSAQGKVILSSAFTWHPNGKYLVAVVDRCICLIDVESGEVKPLTVPTDPSPRPEACVVSPDGAHVAFVRHVNGFNQLFVVDIP